MHIVRVSLSEVRDRGDCVGCGAKSSLATSIDMWPCPSASKEPADCETSFSKLAQSPQRRFTIASRGEEETFKKINLYCYLVGTVRVSCVITYTSLANAVKYDNMSSSPSLLKCLAEAERVERFLSKMLFSNRFVPRGYNMAGLVTLPQHFQ